MKTECDYLSGWIKKRSHTQKSHPKVVNPRDIAGERKKNNKTKQTKKTSTTEGKVTSAIQPLIANTTCTSFLHTPHTTQPPPTNQLIPQLVCFTAHPNKTPKHTSTMSLLLYSGWPPTQPVHAFYTPHILLHSPHRPANLFCSWSVSLHTPTKPQSIHLPRKELSLLLYSCWPPTQPVHTSYRTHILHSPHWPGNLLGIQLVCFTGHNSFLLKPQRIYHHRRQSHFCCTAADHQHNMYTLSTHPTYYTAPTDQPTYSAFGLITAHPNRTPKHTSTTEGKVTSAIQPLIANTTCTSFLHTPRSTQPPPTSQLIPQLVCFTAHPNKTPKHTSTMSLLLYSGWPPTQPVHAFYTPHILLHSPHRPANLFRSWSVSLHTPTKPQSIHLPRKELSLLLYSRWPPTQSVHTSYRTHILHSPHWPGNLLGIQLVCFTGHNSFLLKPQRIYLPQKAKSLLLYSRWPPTQHVHAFYTPHILHSPHRPANLLGIWSYHCTPQQNPKAYIYHGRQSHFCYTATDCQHNLYTLSTHPTYYTAPTDQPTYSAVGLLHCTPQQNPKAYIYYVTSALQWLTTNTTCTRFLHTPHTTTQPPPTSQLTRHLVCFIAHPNRTPKHTSTTERTVTSALQRLTTNKSSTSNLRSPTTSRLTWLLEVEVALLDLHDALIVLHMGGHFLRQLQGQRLQARGLRAVHGQHLGWLVQRRLHTPSITLQH